MFGLEVFVVVVFVLVAGWDFFFVWLTDFFVVIAVVAQLIY